MAPLIRLEEAKTVVVKVGSRLLAATPGGRNSWLDGFAADAVRLVRRGQKLVVVSSGAVALGRGRLGLAGRSLSLSEKQAAAAAGQSLLMRAWDEALQGVGLRAAQILLTPDDTEVRRRFLNARSTLQTLLAFGLVPIVNENDTVATEELRYGDNDRLAARVAQMLGADILVLLSDVDGLYTADPTRDPAARHVPLIEAITPDVEAMAGENAGELGSGGMVTKITAARVAASAGCSTVIALGDRADPLAALERGERASLFLASTTPALAYKSWIAGTLAPAGAFVVDDGAAAAVRRGKSLLAAGVLTARGRFGKGEAVIIETAAGAEIGRGLSRYDAIDATRIVGLRSAAIAALLGYAAGPMIHADDLALTVGGSQRS
ncbi:MAG: glutamate 5-kinase [Caulobacteraceae bacterium]